MGRIKRWNEEMQARFEEGTFARIRSALFAGEDRTDFVRAAVERELNSRASSNPAVPPEAKPKKPAAGERKPVALKR